MEIKIDKQEILNSIGIEFKDNKDYFMYLEQLVDYLYFHNKNYTNKQYYKIEEIREILLNIEVE